MRTVVFFNLLFYTHIFEPKRTHAKAASREYQSSTVEATPGAREPTGPPYVEGSMAGGSSSIDQTLIIAGSRSKKFDLPRHVDATDHHFPPHR